MTTVTVIGAGSLTFTLRLLMDILAVPELRDTEFRFMDISEENLEMATNVCQKMVDDNGLSEVKIEPTLDRRQAIAGTDYVLSLVRVGGLEAFEKDIEIPLKYGVDQCVGDTLAPGGIFYALRSIPVLLDMAADMRAVAPNALLINYANPMAMNTWAVRRAGGVHIVGLCHGVYGGHHQIAEVLGLPQEEVDIICAGINHQTWYIQVTYKGQDMLPYLLKGFKEHPRYSQTEKVRIDILRRFGYYSTESNGHLSEYVPWYRKRPQELEQWISRDVWINGETGGYLRHCRKMANEYDELYPKYMSGEEDLIQLGERSHEHGSYIIESLETGRPYRGHFNVGNTGLIGNLPEGCTVELPCYVDANGISPAWVGDLPIQCAATCRVSVNVQEMAVEAALTGNRELVKLAVLHDPLTGAVCNTEEVWAMCDEMFEALAPWMPQFNGEGRTWSDIPQPNGGALRFPKAAGEWTPPS